MVAEANGGSLPLRSRVERPKRGIRAARETRRSQVEEQTRGEQRTVIQRARLRRLGTEQQDSRQCDLRSVRERRVANVAPRTDARLQGLSQIEPGVALRDVEGAHPVKIAVGMRRRRSVQIASAERV